MRDRLVELGLAFGLLTRLPVGWLIRGAVPPSASGRAVWAYPLVGVVVGAIGGAMLLLGRRVGLPPMLAAAWALAGMVLVSGALHEDGLADTADGFGGGATRARKLEIMRDSRIGGFGAVALILSLTIRGAALTVLPPSAMIAVAVAARASVAAVLWLLPPARPDGLAAGLGVVPGGAAAVALVVAVAAAILMSPWRPAAAAMAASLAGALAVAWLARRQIGGQTGDVCGAAEQAAECLAFTVLASVAR